MKRTSAPIVLGKQLKTCHLTNIRMTTAKNQKIISIGKGVEKVETLCTVSGNVKWCTSMENSMEGTQKCGN
jgi:hypothetical protein